MIAKISTGGGFRGVLNYVFKEDSEIVGGNMAGDDPRTLSAEFAITRELREDIERPCYHVSLALPKGERLDQQTWEKVTNKYLSRLGISPTDHQCVFIRHKDTEYDHLHIVTSRIALNGKVWKPEFDKMKSKNICRELEREHGLTEVSNEKKTYRAKTTQKERQMNKRTGRESEKVSIQEKLNLLLQDDITYTPQELSLALADSGIVLIPNIASTGKVSGFSFQYAGRSYTGSQVGYAWKYLQPHLTMDEGSVAWMQERKKQLQEGTVSDATRSIRNAVWEVGIMGVPFEDALEKQGWRIENGKILKGQNGYTLSAIVDVETLNNNLAVLSRVSKETRDQARRKSQALAKSYYARPRKSFMAEMRNEDLLCAMLLFPQVTAFLVVLSVLTEVARNMQKPKNEAELKMKMKTVWTEAQKDVQAEVKRIQEGMYSARPTRSHPTDITVAEESRRRLREADEDRRPSVREVGTEAYVAAFRGEGRDRGNEGSERVLAVEKTYIDSDGVDGVSRGSGAVAVEPLSARSEQRDVQVNPDVGAVEEWAALAQDLAILTGDERQMEKTASTKSKEAAWEKQNEVFNDENDFVRYRITCVPRREKTETDTEDAEGRWAWVPGQQGDVERFFTAEEVKQKIPMLARKNMEGYDIYVRPMTQKYIFVMIDDINEENLNKMKTDGYRPNAVWKTSTDNYQVVFKMEKSTPRHYGDPLPKGEEDAGAAIVRELTAAYHGDTKNLGVKKSFRLAGYSNKKPDRHGEFTEITETSTGECPKLRALLKTKTETAVTANIQTETEDRRAYLSGKKAFVMDKNMVASEACVQAYMKQNRRVEGLVRYRGWVHDQSTVDYRVCVAMLQEGWHPDSVADCLEKLSPELPERHRNINDYVERTMRAAIGAVEKEKVKEQSRAGQSGPSFFGL